ncbi:MAG: hypothetical protein R3C61_15170 [Bacteroidia bacterium]
MKTWLIFLPALAALLWLGCQTNARPAADNESVYTDFSDRDFKNYWYQGLAEITSYDLQQARYGEIHHGHAVAVFVTEDFSAKKQVKLDNPESAGNDRVPILKLNLSKKFNTGIYPYSMMLSVFTPVDIRNYPYSLKTTMSSQEWCGHVFTQMNLRGNEYHLTGLSYFESEGDENLDIKKYTLEDELWTRIRISPENLPVGEVTLIPGSFYSRLRHKEITPATARISLTENNGIMDYQIFYPEADRTLVIHFEKQFPHKITAWEETYTSGWGPGAQKLTTRAVAKKTLINDYWSRHNNEDLGLRTELGLPLE